MAPHSSTLAWKIPWTEEPGGLQSMGSLRVGHNWATSLSLVVSKESACNTWDLDLIPGWGRSPGEGNGNPLQYSCLENPMDRGAWQAISMGLQESDTTERLSTCTHICKTQILSEIMQKNWRLTQWGSLVLLLLPDSVINLGTATWRISVARTISLEQGLPASFTCISFPWPHSWARVVDATPAGEIVLWNVSITLKLVYQYFGY